MFDLLTIKKQVLPDRQIIDKRKGLVDRLDADSPSVLRRGEMHLFATEHDPAGGWGVNARDTLDQGRLPGTVISDNRRDLAAASPDGDIADGMDSAEPLSDVINEQEDVSRTGHRRTV